MKLADLARALGATLEGDGELEIEDLQPLDRAGPRSLSFVSNQRYVAQLAGTRAAAVILGPGVEGPGCAVLRVDEPYRAFATALGLFARPVLPPLGVAPTAHVSPRARIGEGARIAPGVVVGDGVELGARACLFPGVVIYPESTIGDDFVAHANVVVRERVRIGNRVTLGPGVVVGGDGFGFIPLPGGGVFKLPQIGTVEIADDVEIGANTTVDRATIGATRLEHGVKLDNLVMIAHGCRIGPESLLAGQTGLAGSTTLGARVQLGGQVGAAGHLTIGDDVRVAAQSGVDNDVPPGSVIGGYPAMDVRLWRRVAAAVHRLPDLLRRVRRLERASGAAEPAGPRDE
ncbi:MAG: UDP-3-O-(3-hydroxymyristoyl)glucosamine N-acyltransferase [Thermodesulfobacteriota bacterium]